MLPPIPIIDARPGGPPDIARACESRLRDLLGCARRTYTPALLGLADPASRRWLARAGNPYLGEIDRVAAILDAAGAYALNTSYEWGCTTGGGEDPAGSVRLLRTLDWRQPGLGRNLVLAWQNGPAGDFLNLTWPGFVGLLTAMAPGRFAAAVNQAPMASWGMGLPIDWAIGRIVSRRNRDLPPAHALRKVFETCTSFDEARQLLIEIPLCLPAFFTLAGAQPGEGCVIERTQRHARMRPMPSAAANHWVDFPERGHRRGWKSRQRLTMMTAPVAGAADWLAPPIVNRDTRLVAILNPRCAGLTVQGWERSGPATARLDLPDVRAPRAA